VVLRADGWAMNRKRTQRLMRLMGLDAIYQKPNTIRTTRCTLICCGA